MPVIDIKRTCPLSSHNKSKATPDAVALEDDTATIYLYGARQQGRRPRYLLRRYGVGRDIACGRAPGRSADT